MKLSDTVFQLDNLIVPCLDLIHSLLGDVVHNDLRGYNRGTWLDEGLNTLKTSFVSISFAFVVSLTPEVKIAGLSLSSMLSSSSFVVFLPARRTNTTLSVCMVGVKRHVTVSNSVVPWFPKLQPLGNMKKTHWMIIIVVQTLASCLSED